MLTSEGISWLFEPKRRRGRRSPKSSKIGVHKLQSDVRTDMSTHHVSSIQFNLLLALLIACTKATLVVLYFMHLRWSEKLNWAFAGMSIFFLILLIGMTFDDFLTRGWIAQPKGWLALTAH